MTRLLIRRGIVNKKYKENLLKSFKYSFKKGYGIETDIHATRDNEFICFHDFTLNRIFKKKVSVKNIDYSQIKNISSKFNKPIPILKDLLRASKNKYPLFIEIKPFFSNRLIRKLLKETSKYSKCTFYFF
jgi:Glycerophosphoryl diester phosphodiesterase